MGTPPISCRCIRGREVGSEWIFFTAKHFVIKKNLLTLHLEKKCCTTSLYNIKTMGYIIACDNTNDKNT